MRCQHGADRTGLVSALYRMVVQGWDAEAAVDGMVRGGLRLPHALEGAPAFPLRRVDAAAPQRRAFGLPEAVPPPAPAPVSP